MANSPFYANLVKSNEQIKEQRAQMLEKETEKNLRKKVDELESARDQLVYEQTRHLDLSPENADDLVYRKDFDPKKWNDELVQRDYQLYVADIKFQRSLNLYNQLFKAPEPSPYAPDESAPPHKPTPTPEPKAKK